MEGAEEGTQSPPLDGNGGDIEKMSRDLRDMMRNRKCPTRSGGSRRDRWRPTATSGIRSTT